MDMMDLVSLLVVLPLVLVSAVAGVPTCWATKLAASRPLPCAQQVLCVFAVLMAYVPAASAASSWPALPSGVGGAKALVLAAAACIGGCVGLYCVAKEWRLRAQANTEAPAATSDDSVDTPPPPVCPTDPTTTTTTTTMSHKAPPHKAPSPANDINTRDLIQAADLRTTTDVLASTTLAPPSSSSSPSSSPCPSSSSPSSSSSSSSSCSLSDLDTASDTGSDDGVCITHLDCMTAPAPTMPATTTIIDTLPPTTPVADLATITTTTTVTSSTTTIIIEPRFITFTPNTRSLTPITPPTTTIPSTLVCNVRPTIQPTTAALLVNLPPTTPATITAVVSTLVLNPRAPLMPTTITPTTTKPITVTLLPPVTPTTPIPSTLFHPHPPINPTTTITPLVNLPPTTPTTVTLPVNLPRPTPITPTTMALLATLLPSPNTPTKRASIAMADLAPAASVPAATAAGCTLLLKPAPGYTALSALMSTAPAAKAPTCTIDILEDAGSTATTIAPRMLCGSAPAADSTTAIVATAPQALRDSTHDSTPAVDNASAPEAVPCDWTPAGYNGTGAADATPEVAPHEWAPADHDSTGAADPTPDEAPHHDRTPPAAVTTVALPGPIYVATIEDAMAVKRLRKEHRDLKECAVDLSLLCGLVQRHPYATGAALAGVALLYTTANVPVELVYALESQLLALIDASGDRLLVAHVLPTPCEQPDGSVVTMQVAHPGIAWQVVLQCGALRWRLEADAQAGCSVLARMLGFALGCAWGACMLQPDTRESLWGAEGVTYLVDALAGAVGELLQQRLEDSWAGLEGVLVAAALGGHAHPAPLFQAYYVDSAKLAHTAKLLVGEAPGVTGREVAAVLLAAGQLRGLLLPPERKQRLGVYALLCKVQAEVVAAARGVVPQLQLPVHVLAGALSFFADFPELVTDRAVFAGLVEGVLVAVGQRLPSMRAVDTLLLAAMSQPLLRGPGGGRVLAYLEQTVMQAPCEGIKLGWERADVMGVVGGLLARHAPLLPRQGDDMCDPAVMALASAVTALTAWLLHRGTQGWLDSASEAAVQEGVRAAVHEGTDAAVQGGACVVVTRCSRDLHDPCGSEEAVCQGLVPVVATIDVTAQVWRPAAGERGPGEGGRPVAAGVCVSLVVPGWEAAGCLSEPLVLMRRHQLLQQ